MMVYRQNTYFLYCVASFNRIEKIAYYTQVCSFFIDYVFILLNMSILILCNLFLKTIKSFCFPKKSFFFFL